MKAFRRRLDRLAEDLNYRARSTEDAAKQAHFDQVIRHATDIELHELLAIAEKAKLGPFDESRADAIMLPIEARWRAATEDSPV